MTKGLLPGSSLVSEKPPGVVLSREKLMKKGALLIYNEYSSINIIVFDNKVICMGCIWNGTL